jgi:prepilin-type N-terminal cleavage/methylation domain-containing protein
VTTPSSSKGAGVQAGRWREQRGVTLIELLVAMLMALVVSLAAFAILQFTTDDVSRITSRAHVDQTGRIALQKIMLQLHSACVALEVNPIVVGSGGEKIKFISESGTQAAFTTVSEHEIAYTKATETLTEQTFPNTSAEKEGNYTFSTTASSTTKLLTGVKQTEVLNKTTSLKEKIPIFQYYRYYKTGDAIPTGDTEVPYGELNPSALKGEGSKEELSKAEAENVAKTTMSFTLTPEGHESIIAKGGQPIVLEDSAVFRLAPTSTATGHLNTPCSEAP